MRGIEILTLTVRKKYLILIFFLVSTNLVAQHEVPYPVKIQFMDDYISASAITWSTTNEGYLVSFNHQSHSKKATYSNKGSRLLLETKLMSLAQLPRAVHQAITKRYKSFLAEGIWQAETLNEVTFKLLVRRDEKMYALEFLETGKLKNKIRLFSGRTQTRTLTPLAIQAQ